MPTVLTVLVNMVPIMNLSQAFMLLSLFISAVLGAPHQLSAAEIGQMTRADLARLLDENPNYTPDHGLIEDLINIGLAEHLRVIFERRHYEWDPLWPNCYMPSSRGDQATLNVLTEYGLRISVWTPFGGESKDIKEPGCD